MDLYILKKGKPVRVHDVIAWAMWYEHHHIERQVALDKIGKIEVSTVFLGIDLRFFDLRFFGSKGPPILWETMVFGEQKGVYPRQQRYSSLAQALAGHKAIVRDVKAKLAEMN